MIDILSFKPKCSICRRNIGNNMCQFTSSDLVVSNSNLIVPMPLLHEREVCNHFKPLLQFCIEIECSYGSKCVNSKCQMLEPSFREPKHSRFDM